MEKILAKVVKVKKKYRYIPKVKASANLLPEQIELIEAALYDWRYGKKTKLSIQRKKKRKKQH